MCYNIIGNVPTISRMEIIDMACKWTPPSLPDFVRRYQSGETRKQLARFYGVTDKVIVRILTENGVTLRDDHSHTLPVNEIVIRYTGGESANSLAAHFGVSRTVINRRLLAEGVPLRDSGQANRLMMSNRSNEENLRNVRAAHVAARGRTTTFEELCKRAATREQRQLHVSPYELLFREWLSERGIESVPQKAIGTYNADLAAFPVVVEIFGGNWHGHDRHASRAPERFRYLLDSGWNVVIVWVDRRQYGISTDCADYIAAFVEQSRADPSFRGEYRVIWSDGKEVPSNRLNLDNISLVPSRS
jgi:very-short-patch-repair endonuclease/uncharacterized protein (DUF433 family)